MANFRCLSDGNHAKPQSLAWCLPETINRAARLKLIPVLLKPQPKAVRQTLNPSRCFGVCWPSVVAIRNSKFCWVTCLVWGSIAEVPYLCIYNQMSSRLFLGASWPFILGREPWNIDYCFSALLILRLVSEGALNIPPFSKMLWNQRVNLYLCIFTLNKIWFIQIPKIWGPNSVISAWQKGYQRKTCSSLLFKAMQKAKTKVRIQSLTQQLPLGLRLCTELSICSKKKLGYNSALDQYLSHKESKTLLTQQWNNFVHLNFSILREQIISLCPAVCFCLLLLHILQLV